MTKNTLEIDKNYQKRKECNSGISSMRTSAIVLIFLPLMAISLFAVLSCSSNKKETETDIVAALANMDKLKVYEKTDGSYIIDYLNADGEIIFHTVQTIPAVNTELYNQGGVTIVLNSSGEVFCTEPITNGMLTNVVNPGGIVVEQTTVSGSSTYAVHFVNQVSGNLEYTANIIKVGTDWFANFLAPISQQVPVSRTTDFDGNVLYDFNFDNAAGSGNVHFWTTPGGTITSTTYTH